MTNVEQLLLDELADLMEAATEEYVNFERIDTILDELDVLDPLPEPIDPEAAMERFKGKLPEIFGQMEQEGYCGREKEAPRAEREGDQDDH